MARRIRMLLSGVIGATALAVVPATVASAQEEPTCPPSVDTVGEGWICAQVFLNTPSQSPTDQQIGLWEGVLNADGRRAVAEGIVFSDASAEAKVRALYSTELGREPGAEAVAYWSDVIQDANSELPFEYGVFDSGEYLSQFESPEAFVNDQYQYYLGREASIEERSYWAGLFNEGVLSNEGITRAIATSAEAGDVRAQRLYDDWVRRAPDASGLAYWSDLAATQGLYATIVDFSITDESFNTLGQYGMCLAAGGEC